MSNENEVVAEKAMSVWDACYAWENAVDELARCKRLLHEAQCEVEKLNAVLIPALEKHGAIKHRGNILMLEDGEIRNLHAVDSISIK
jgi:hypothetical protein